MNAILFDLSDTLYKNKELEEQYPEQLHHLLARDRGLTVEEAQAFMKKTKKELEEKTGKHITKVAVMSALGYTRAQVHEEFCRVDPAKYLVPDFKLAALIERLSKKYRLGMITNLRRAQVIKTLKALGVNPDLFDVVVGEDDVKEIKPHHEPFLKALELLAESPGNCVYVADSIDKDLKPAKEVGMKTVLVGGENVDSAYVDAKVESILAVEKAVPV